MFKDIRWETIKDAFLETFLMNLVTGIFVLIFGLLLGFLLYKTKDKNKITYKVANFLTSTFRSIPFIVLIILMLPVTNSIFNFLFGSDQRLLFNWQGAVPALIISATPFYARLVENSLNEVPNETKEMLMSLGAKETTIFRYIFSEAMPSLLAGFIQTLVTLIGFSSAAAIIGAGGLGDLASRERNHTGIVLIATALILLLVFIIQNTGDYIKNKLDKR